MNDKNTDGWNPTDYKIYTTPESETQQTSYTDISSKSKPPKGGKSVMKAIVAILLIAIIATGGVFAYKLYGKIKGKLDNNVKDVTPITTTTVRITFPEGYTIYQMAELLEEKGVCSKENFYTAANTPVEGIEIPDRGERVFLLEGYLFPDTYDFYLDEPAYEVVDRFIENYNSKITDEIKQKATDLGYSMDEMLTLASIIQKECDKDLNECKNVSSVFHNRLDTSRNIYLGSDVTYFYLKNMADYLGGSESERFDNMLLNYYTYSKYKKGLPVGPICNPGIKAITAAVEPNKTDYQFFLTDESGENFYYAKTFEEHKKNGKTAGIME